MAHTRQTVTHAFRKRMFRDAFVMLAVVVAVLLIVVGTLDREYFAIVALILIPTAALTFNLRQRRAFAALQTPASSKAGKRDNVHV